jgi:hypothetical protein
MEDFPPGPPNAFIAEELRIPEAGAMRQLLARDQFNPSTLEPSTFTICADNVA